MKLFLSWSGPTSKALAMAFHEWLPVMFGGVEPFVSSEDIDKGVRWATVLDEELEETDFGITFVTPDNLGEPWIMFEAGALTKSVAYGRCACVLYEVEKSNLQFPLARFQAVDLEKLDIFRLVEGINTELGEYGQGERELERRFERLWPDLERSIQRSKVSSSHTPPPVRSERDLLEEVLATVRLLIEERRDAPTVARRPTGEEVSLPVPEIEPGWRQRQGKHTLS
jgi:hypothetical protein